MRNFELDKLVRIGDVAMLLEKIENYSDNGTHTLDLGVAGDHDVDCDALDLDIDSFLGELIAIADRT